MDWGVTVVKIQAGVDYKFVTGPASARVPLSLYPLPTLNKLAMTLPPWKVMVLTRRVTYILALTVMPEQQKYEKSYSKL